MVEAGIEHRFLRVEGRRLFEHAHPEVAPVDDVARVIAVFSRKQRQEGRLAYAVLGDEAHLLPLGNGEADVLEKYQRTERFGQVLYV